MLRFAPSPTGDMHISDLRVAILNYIVAKQRGEEFLVRIEDSNTQKNIEGKDTEIMMILEKFAIKHDSLYHQSQRLAIHQTLAIRLLQEEKAFICKCTEQELTEAREIAKRDGVAYRYNDKCQTLAQDEYKIIKESKEPFVIRIKKPKQDINNSKIDSFIIMRADNTPTENFASACSDMLNDISLIICKEEQLDNIQKQIYIKSSLGYEQKTQYIYLPTILNSEDKSTSIKWLFEEGFIPDAILNYLVLIGNSNTPKEIFTLPEAIEWFDLNGISKEPISFDISKLRFINREHLKLIDDKRLSTLFGFADADIGKLAKLYLGECSTINELEAKIRPIFKPKNFDGEWGKQMRTIENIIAQASAFETLDELKKHITKESGLRDENLLNPLQILLTGNENSPELNKIYPLIKSYILEVAS
jgi:glutamyl-tRNA synthetase